MQPQPYPILEFDPTPQAILEPGVIHQPLDVAESCVVCFFQDVINDLLNKNLLRPVFEMHSEIGAHPAYDLEVDGRHVTLFHPGLGAPMAAGLLEEVIARGCRKFVACGGCGVLDPAIAVGHILVPTAALRDEGTSYHYLAPSREVEPTPAALAAVERVLNRHQVEYLPTKTWTTDGLYRETTYKTALRRSEGCLAVDMEASAFFAVARFRDVEFAQILYGGDTVVTGAWDSRNWVTLLDIRERLLYLSAEAALEI